jgi:hypothetical protein
MLQSSSQSNVSSSPEVIGPTSMLSRSSGRRKLVMEFVLYKQQSRPYRSRRCEIDTYLEDSLVSEREGEDFDILKW